LKGYKKPVPHVAERYFQAVKTLGVVNDEHGLEYYIPATITFPNNQIPAKFRDGYIVFVNGAKFATKRIPISVAVSIIRGIGLPVILIGGKEDRERGAMILNLADRQDVVNLCGQVSINQSALIIKNSKAIITPDTGMMHIAAALGKKIISIWGSTHPGFGMYPYMPITVNQATPNFSIIETSGLNCRPCSKLGYQSCPKTHFRCMKNIDVKHVLEIVNSSQNVT
jgi:ADP-heptose:LPS heptosyltransferase